jgi:hypothetical protein
MSVNSNRDKTYCRDVRLLFCYISKYYNVFQRNKVRRNVLDEFGSELGQAVCCCKLGHNFGFHRIRRIAVLAKKPGSLLSE